MVLKISTVHVQGKVANQVRLGLPAGGSFAPGLIILDSNASVVDTIDDLNAAAMGGGGGGVGWVRTVDLFTQSGAPISSRVYQDPPANTILQSAISPEGTVRILVEASYPKVDVNGVAAILPLVGSIYRGTVDLVLAASGNIVSTVMDADDQLGASDTIAVVLDLPPVIAAATFTGGYPGAQTELKAGDVFSLLITADKNFDQVVVEDFGAGQSAAIGVAVGASATVALTIADRGNVAQLLGARVQVRDAVTGALSATFSTNSAGVVDGVNVLNLNNLQPSVAFGAETYPASQQALKGAEAATVAATQSDFDTILYDDNGTGHLTVTSPSTAEALKTVTRAGGSYNIEGDGGVANVRATAIRLANDATTIATAVISIANIAATVTVSEATARARSGVAPGNDTVITVAADQELLNAPSIDPAVSRGTFQGAGFAGGPKTWTRDLRVPDSENPADGSLNTWINLVATNLSGIATAVITGDDTYVVGGFTPRTLNYAAFTANSTETFPLTDESKLVAGAFSNGNTAVIQPFGTADTSDVGKEGWAAPTSASGVAVQMRMLHIPSVSANSGGLTLTLVEETV